MLKNMPPSFNGNPVINVGAKRTIVPKNNAAPKINLVRSMSDNFMDGILTYLIPRRKVVL